VLRYWEQEFTQLRPVKRRGNRRYYQHHEVLMIRRIRDLLYEQGFTISGARNKMQEIAQSSRAIKKESSEDNFLEESLNEGMGPDSFDEVPSEDKELVLESAQRASSFQATSSLPTLRRELMDIRDLLSI
jgi:DNA-binding transcriptional MerR regulator